MKHVIRFLNIFMIAFLLFNSTELLSQEGDYFEPQMPDFIPPTPTAYELGKYGDIPVNESTGIANVSIPLYTYGTPNLSVPISLGYATSGVKVNQVASWVGMGWNLSAGGTITRQIRGMADEDTFSRSFPTESSLVALRNGTLAQRQQYYGILSNIANREYVDYQADIYNFSFNGYSGSFYLDESLNPVVIKKESELKIGVVNNHFTNGFTITTPNGIIYTFDVTEKTKQRMVCSAGPNASTFKTTSWKLSKITHPLGDEIYYEYANTTNYFYVTSLSETYGKNNPSSAPPGASPPPEGRTRCAHHSYVQGYVLTKISSNRYSGVVEFNADMVRADVNDYKLNAIVVKSPGNAIVKEFAFNYNQVQSAIPYYGATSFPTAGGTDENYRLFLDTVTEKDNQGNATNGKVYSFEYETPNLLPKRLSLSQDLYGYYNGKTNQSLLPDTHGISFNITKGDRSFDFNHAKKGILTKVTYPTKGYTTFEYESGPTAIRIKKVASYSENGATPKITKYYYKSRNHAIAGTGGTTHQPLMAQKFTVTRPSLILFMIEDSENTPDGQPDTFLFDRLEFRSSAQESLYLTNADLFLYEKVTIGYGDNFEGGGVEKKFSVVPDEPAQHVRGYEIINAEQTNSGLLNGTLLEETYFVKDGSSARDIKNTKYKYKIDESKSDVINNFTGHVNFHFPTEYTNSDHSELVEGYDVMRYQVKSKWRSIDSVITKEYFDSKTLTSITTNDYTNGYAGLPSQTTTLDALGDKLITKFTYPTSGTLFNQHRIANPTLIEGSKETGVVVSPLASSQTSYATFYGLYLPQKISVSKGGETRKDRVIYHSYDNKGNPIEVSQKDGTHIYYIWGYQQTQPIAKIVNFKGSQINSGLQSYINTAVNISNSETTSGAEANLRTALKNISDHAALANAQMTYFTYDPLIGVTSVTDVRGDTMYYVYDSFNRLKHVKDKNGKILKEHHYNYKNQ